MATLRNHQLMLACIATLAGAASSHAAVVEVTSVQWNDNSARTVSVFGGNSFVSGDIGSTLSGGGTLTPVSLSLGGVEEYRLFNGSNKTTGYASSGSRISGVTTAATNSTATVANAVFTSNDPNTDPANFTSSTSINSIKDTVNGSIDVTGLSSGTIYLIYGSNGAEGRGTSLTVTQGASNFVTAQSGGGYQVSGGSSFWVNADTISVATKFDFTNDGSENTISFAWSQNNAGKFLGVVVSDTSPIPEPGSLALLGLGGVLIARRRRADRTSAAS